MSDSRQNFTFTADTSDAETKIALLKAQIADLQKAITQYSGAPGLVAGLTKPLEAAQQQLAEIQRGVSLASAQLIKNYQDIEGFSARAVAAMRGGFSGVAAATDAWTQREVDAATKSRVLTQSIQEAIGATTNLTAATTSHAARQAELNAVFGASEASAAGFGTAMRRIVTLFDELARGQRGQGFATLGAALKDITSSSTVLAGSFATLGAVLGTAAIARGVFDLGELAEKTRAGAQASGMSVVEFSKLQGALTLIGLKADSADLAIRTLAKNLSEAGSEPSSKAAEALHAIGISQAEIVANSGNVSGMFDAISTALNKFADGANKAYVEEILFGRGAESIAPLLGKTAGGIEELKQKAEELGITFTDKTAAGAIQAKDKIEELSKTIEGHGREALLSWVGPIETVTEGLGKLVSVIGSVVSSINSMSSAAGTATGDFFGRLMLERAPHSGTGAGGMSEVPGYMGTAGAAAGLATGIKVGGGAPEVPSVTGQVKGMQALTDALDAENAKISAAGGTRKAIEENILKNDVKFWQSHAKDPSLSTSEQADAARKANEDIIRLNEAKAPTGSNMAARQDYQAFVREEENKLTELKGNVNAQLAVLEEWKQRAGQTYFASAGLYKSAMAEIQRASDQVNKQVADSFLHSMHDTLGVISNEIHAFESNMQAGTKTPLAGGRRITSQEAFGFDIQETAKEYQKAIDSIGQALNNPNLTDAQKSALLQLLAEVESKENELISNLVEKYDAAGERAAEKFAKPFQAEFNSLGGSFEKALTEAITHTATGEKIARQLETSLVGKGVDILGSAASNVAGKGAASLLGVQGEQGLGNVLGKAIGDRIQSVFQSLLPNLFKEGLNTATQGGTQAAAMAPIVSTQTAALVGDNEANTSLIVAAIEASAVQITGATVAAGLNPEILGNKAFYGGIASAAGGMAVNDGRGGQISILHPREMVLPATISDRIMRSVTGDYNSPQSRGGGSNANMNFTYSPTMRGSQPFASRQQAETLLRRHGDMMFNMAREFARSGRTL